MDVSLTLKQAKAEQAITAFQGLSLAVDSWKQDSKLSSIAKGSIIGEKIFDNVVKDSCLYQGIIAPIASYSGRKVKETLLDKGKENADSIANTLYENAINTIFNDENKNLLEKAITDYVSTLNEQNAEELLYNHSPISYYAFKSYMKAGEVFGYAKDKVTSSVNYVRGIYNSAENYYTAIKDKLEETKGSDSVPVRILASCGECILIGGEIFIEITFKYNLHQLHEEIEKQKKEGLLKDNVADTVLSAIGDCQEGKFENIKDRGVHLFIQHTNEAINTYAPSMAAEALKNGVNSVAEGGIDQLRKDLVDILMKAARKELLANKEFQNFIKQQIVLPGVEFSCTATGVATEFSAKKTADFVVRKGFGLMSSMACTGLVAPLLQEIGSAWGLNLSVSQIMLTPAILTGAAFVCDQVYNTIYAPKIDVTTPEGINDLFQPVVIKLEEIIQKTLRNKLVGITEDTVNSVAKAVSKLVVEKASVLIANALA